MEISLLHGSCAMIMRNNSSPDLQSELLASHYGVLRKILIKSKALCLWQKDLVCGQGWGGLILQLSKHSVKCIKPTSLEAFPSRTAFFKLQLKQYFI